MIRDNAVDLLRAFQGVEPVAGLHMNHRDMELHRRQCRCHGGVGIPVHQQSVRLFLQQDLLNGHQHFSGHAAMGAPCNAQIVVRSGNVHFRKEHIGHIGIVMLAGVH